MDLHVTAYLIYLVIAITLTLWVGKTLYRNGEVFLVEIFHGKQMLAQSVNKLLLTGFYLVNFGYTVYALKVTQSITDVQVLFEVLSVKLGIIILALGGVHFLNIFVLFSLRNKAREDATRTK